MRQWLVLDRVPAPEGHLVVTNLLSKEHAFFTDLFGIWELDFDTDDGIASCAFLYDVAGEQDLIDLEDHMEISCWQRTSDDGIVAHGLKLADSTTVAVVADVAMDKIVVDIRDAVGASQAFCDLRAYQFEMSRVSLTMFWQAGHMYKALNLNQYSGRSYM